MARLPAREEYGAVPPTLGWQKMDDWFRRDPENNTITEMARVVGVKRPSVWAWKWRDKSPSAAHLAIVCGLVGASIGDWWVPLSNERRAAKRRRGKAA